MNQLDWESVSDEDQYDDDDQYNDLDDDQYWIASASHSLHTLLTC